MPQATESTETSPRIDLSRSDGQRVRRLIAVHGPALDAVKPIALEGQRVVIGREPGDGGVSIPDRELSRRHFELSPAPGYGVYRASDLDSKNGTFLDGRRIEEPEYLAAGSVLRAGSTIFVYSERLVPPDLADLECPPRGSLALAHAERIADLAAPTPRPVLLLGPTGAGKERLAARIHDRSGRPGKLVPINCATLNRELLGSELFGHAKGAFSGAAIDRAGLFRAAEGGTLFLDEIAELPLDQQPALLRVIQEGKIRPVGADREIAVDVRVISATHQDLDRLEKDGSFRSDLYARLAGVVIRVPGLSERREEILPLFLDLLPKRRPIGLAAAEALLLHGWPRNVRELEGAAAHVELFAKNAAEIDLGCLPETLARPASDGSKRAAPKKEELERLLAEHEGNVAAVARAIGDHRQQVYRWIKAYGIEPGSWRR